MTLSAVDQIIQHLSDALMATGHAPLDIAPVVDADTARLATRALNHTTVHYHADPDFRLSRAVDAVARLTCHVRGQFGGCDPDGHVFSALLDAAKDALQPPTDYDDLRAGIVGASDDELADLLLTTDFGGGPAEVFAADVAATEIVRRQEAGQLVAA
jgi:hypothetical protein